MLPGMLLLPRIAFVPVCLALALAGLVPSRAQAADTAVVFPDPAQVTADYPDLAERYTAFNLLAKFIGQWGSKPMSQSDFEKMTGYQNAALTIMQAKTANGSLNKDYTDFVTQTGKLRMDPKFQQSVIARYHLPGGG